MRTTRPTVYLWDIDGTLISTGGAGRRSMEGAFRDLHGEPGVQAISFGFGGMTDRRIVRDGLAALEHHAPTPEEIDHVLEQYLAHLAVEVTRAETYIVHRGVPEALAMLAGLENVAIGLGTGNVKKGAYAKLARGALGSSFAFGGFGCDAEDRTELLRVGATRGAAALGQPLAACRVVVIGDTPKDVAAAQGIGADCIGVGTGGDAPASLKALGAQAAFATLDEDGVHAVLIGD